MPYRLKKDRHSGFASRSRLSSREYDDYRHLSERRPTPRREAPLPDDDLDEDLDIDDDETLDEDVVDDLIDEEDLIEDENDPRSP